MTPTGRPRTLPDGTGHDRTTPAELHAALDARRKALGLKWWQIAVDLDISTPHLGAMRHGHASPGLRERAEEWLRRKPDPPRT